MKKEKKTYLLLVIVLAIWGVLGFQIFKAVNPSEDVLPIYANTEKIDIIKPKKRDTFSLLANYRDPFLGIMPKSNTPKKKKIQPKKEALPEKSIAYTGFITEGKSGNKVFFLTIEGQQQILSKNQEFNGVKLLSGNAEKVRVKSNGKIRNITLTQ